MERNWLYWGPIRKSSNSAVVSESQVYIHNFFLGYLIYQWFSIIKKPQQLAKIGVSHCILPGKCVPTIYKTELKLYHLTLHIFNLLKNYSLHVVFLISYLFKLTFLIKDKFKVEI